MPGFLFSLYRGKLTVEDGAFDGMDDAALAARVAGIIEAARMWQGAGVREGISYDVSNAQGLVASRGASSS
jgi:hypothetical protein